MSSSEENATAEAKNVSAKTVAQVMEDGLASNQLRNVLLEKILATLERIDVNTRRGGAE